MQISNQSIKKESINEKESYRPDSILPNLSNIFKRCMHDQLIDYFNKILSKYQWDLEKGLSQHYLLSLTEKLRISLDSQSASAALWTGLSEVYYYPPQHLLIAKLYDYGIKQEPLNLLFSYLRNRKQTVCLRLSNTYNEWIHNLFGVPQGSILIPLLFNKFLRDLFLFLCNILIAKYADDDTPYCTSLKISNVFVNLENAAKTLLQWFKDIE